MCVAKVMDDENAFVKEMNMLSVLPEHTNILRHIYVDCVSRTICISDKHRDLTNSAISGTRQSDSASSDIIGGRSIGTSN